MASIYMKQQSHDIVMFSQATDMVDSLVQWVSSCLPTGQPGFESWPRHQESRDDDDDDTQRTAEMSRLLCTVPDKRCQSWTILVNCRALGK